MDQLQLITLIVAASGIALALLGIILASVAKIAASRTAAELQSLQQQLAQTQSARWMQDKELENLLRIRKALLDCIQKLKDELTRILHAKKGELSKDAANKSVSDAGRVFSKLCEDHGEKLADAEQAAVQLAKDAAVEATYQTRTFLEDLSDPADISSGHRMEVSRLRAELTEAQFILRGRVQDRMIKRVLSEPDQ